MAEKDPKKPERHEKVVNFRVKMKRWRELEAAMKFKGISTTDLMRFLTRKWLKRIQSEMALTRKKRAA